jgi:TnpA family transposase
LLGAVIGGAIGTPGDRDEAHLARRLLHLLGPGMLLLADRAFDSAAFLAEVNRTGAKLLVRAGSSRTPAVFNDRAFGIGHKIVAGTDRDCVHAIDLFFSSGGASLPEVLITDTGSYSDLVFGIAQLLGVDYRPALADLPDQKGWRADAGADYGGLNTFARGKLDLDKVRRHWGEILRLIGSIYTSTVSASDVVKALQRDGRPTALGEAIATYGRIFKTLHILSIIDSQPYRRGIKGMRNLQEGRHALAGKIFHGRKGELFQRYREGMEDQLGALGIVLNCVVLCYPGFPESVFDAA